MGDNKKAYNNIQIKTVKRETLPEKIIAEIKSLIDSGQITHGSRLPNEREFARMLGVGRPSLREALKALSVLGIVVHKHGKGNFLAKDYKEWPREPFSVFFSIKKGALIELYEARKGMEAFAAALAAQRATPKNLHKIENALNKMRESTDDYVLFYNYDADFHRGIIAATGNGFIQEIMEKIYKLTFETRSILWKSADEFVINPKQDFIKHEDLFKFIVAGDAKAASNCVVEYMTEVLYRVKQGLISGKKQKKSDS